MKKVRFRTLKSINKRNAKDVLRKYAACSMDDEVVVMFSIPIGLICGPVRVCWAEKIAA